MKTPSSSGSRSNSSRKDYLEEQFIGDSLGEAMLPIFLNDICQKQHPDNHSDLLEVTLQINTNSIHSDEILVCNVTPKSDHRPNTLTSLLDRSFSATSKLRRKFTWLRSSNSSCKSEEPPVLMTDRDSRKLRARLQRSRSSAQQALNGLRFIDRTTAGGHNCKSGGASQEMWIKVEIRFRHLARDGLLARENFGECIGMVESSNEFATGIFDALARRKKQRIEKITKEELHDFWLQLSDQSFDARLQIFFDMADRNGDGRITREEVQELIMISASANKLSQLKEQAQEYASLIMEELDPEKFGYIELWQLETLLLQRDTYMNYSRTLSTSSVGRKQTTTSFRLQDVVHRLSFSVKCFLLENLQRSWIILLWVIAMSGLFAWKFIQYKNRSSFQVMGYCLTTAKGAAETLKLNMALILLPVCRNTITWLRSTRARLFVPFDDSINFHKTIACAISIGVLLHAGNHLACDFPRLISSSPAKFSSISSDFNYKRPTYERLLDSVEGVTGVLMVVLMIISFTLATNSFRKNLVRLPPPFNRLTGFNAFWYSHHLLGLVYILLLVHGSFLFLAHKWYEKTTWMYISIPLILCLGERSLRTCRSEHISVQILKVSILPGNVFSLVMSKPNGFRYRSGQYIFLRCPMISPFEWHPFSITSAPGDNYLSVHIRTVGDWTQGLKQVFTESNDSSPPSIGQARFRQCGHLDQRRFPKLLVDGPYGAPAQDYRNYDVLVLVGLGIGATPFISILRDLLNNTRAEEMDSTTETSRSDDSLNSFTSSSLTSGGKKKAQRTKSAHFYWVTREPESFEWFKGVMNEVAEMDQKGQIELHNYLTSVYEEGDARSTLLTMVQALNHAKHGVDILSGTRVRTHFARPDWTQVFAKLAAKHPCATVGVFYCGMPVLAKELKKLSLELSHSTTTRFEFHKEYF